MEKKKILINHSNYLSKEWEKTQKNEWDDIIDISLPEISLEINEKELSKIVKEKFMELRELMKSYKNENENIEIWIYLEGELSYCYMLFDLLINLGTSNFKGIAIPIFKKEIIEKNNKKNLTFKFIKWIFLKRRE